MLFYRTNNCPADIITGAEAGGILGALAYYGQWLGNIVISTTRSKTYYIKNYSASLKRRQNDYVW